MHEGPAPHVARRRLLRYTRVMSRNFRCRLALAACLLAAGFFFFNGIRWGLPSKNVDALLFGDQPVWSGQKILQLGGGWAPKPGSGAEIDPDPLVGRDKPLPLNQTDAQRAQILLRYRLYSYQPDEMLTFRALAGMNPARGKLDPRGYQYGGLWVYGVGGFLQIASALRLIYLTSDLTHYLDHPEDFAKFYVVARLYSVGWGLLGVWAAFTLVRRWVGGWRAPMTAGLCYACLPAVVTMAHEAKPHLPGAVLTLLAILCADSYARRGGARRWMFAGAVCGAAVGMVPTALWSFALLPLMTLFRRLSWGRRVAVTVGAAGVGICVYAATNPYVVIHLIRGDSILAASAANTASFYGVHNLVQGATHTLDVIREGTSWVLALAAVAAAVIRFGIHASRYQKSRAKGRRIRLRPLPWLLAAPVALTLGQLVFFGAGKGMEYGRFALLPDIAVVVAAVVGLARWARTAADSRFTLLYLTLWLSAASAGAKYLQNFIRDAADSPPRILEARRLAQLAGKHPLRVALTAEPAPYSLPPVNLFDWPLVLLPRGATEFDADVLICAVDDPADPPRRPGIFVLPPAYSAPLTPISWAAKPFLIELRKGAEPTTATAQ